MGRTKEKTALVEKVAEIQNFTNIRNNDFKYNDMSIVIRSSSSLEQKHGFNIYFLGLTAAKVLKANPEKLVVMLVLADETKIIYLPGKNAREIFSKIPVTSEGQWKFKIRERGSYLALEATGLPAIKLSQYLNIKPWESTVRIKPAQYGTQCVPI